MAIEQQIKDILTRELPGATVEVERDTDSGKVGGRIIWDGFAGTNKLRRQNRIFGLLRRHLTTAQTQEISFIFTYTTEDFANLQAAV